MQRAELVKGPTDPKEFDEKDWAQWLGQQEWCRGNTSIPAILLGKLTDGIRFSYTNSSPFDFDFPQMHFDPKDQLHHARYFWPVNVIAISLFKLGQACRHSFEEIVTLDSYGKQIFGGHIPDHYLLVGAEEGHHACFRHEHGIDDEGSSTEISNLAEHDAMQIEFEALQATRDTADHFQMPAITRQIIEGRIEAAEALRRQD
jgi:hypothetical protein